MHNHKREQYKGKKIVEAGSKERERIERKDEGSNKKIRGKKGQDTGEIRVPWEDKEYEEKYRELRKKKKKLQRMNDEKTAIRIDIR